MKRSTLTALVTMMLASAPAFASGHRYDARGTRSWHQGYGVRPMLPPPDPDPAFLVHAHETALAEVELARLAMTRSRDPDVRGYAERVLEDDGELDRIVSGRAAEIGEMMPAFFPSCADLDGLRGAQFDVAFLQRSMDAHDEIRAELASYKEMTGGELHEEISRAFDRLVDDREIAKPLHDRIRNESRHRDRHGDRDRDGDES